MSTTTRGPSTPVVRRMMPSGSVNRGLLAGGVIHPFVQVAVFGPLVGRGVSGVAGGVGEVVGDPGVTAVIGGAVDDGSDEGPLPSHEASPTTNAQTDIAVANLRTDAPRVGRSTG